MFREKIVLSYFENFLERLNSLKVIKRELIIEEFNNKAISIIGPRRAGKTTFLLDYLRNKYKEFIYLNFESVELRHLNSIEVLEVISLFKSNFFNTDVILLDEIQNIKN